MGTLGSNCLYNIDHFKLYGLELEGAIHLGERFRATAAYVYQDFEVDNTGFEDSYTYYLPALLPQHKVKLLASFKVWEDGWFKVSSRYVGDRETQGGDKMDSYITVDVGFEQTFRLYGTEFTAQTFVNNATGTHYEEIYGYEMPKYYWGFVLGVKL